jgi:1,4-alpha-glucan branching enzyme
MTPKSPVTATADIRKIVKSECHDPFAILGMHPIRLNSKNALVVRAFLRDAQAVQVLDPSSVRKPWPMRLLHPDGLFEAVIADRARVFPYRLRITNYQGATRTIVDPYSFLPILGDLDLHLFGEGNHLRLWEKLGAHVMTVAGVRGVHFAVWAPNAKRVSLVGDFNAWDGRWHQMRVLGSSGVWELFVPGLAPGEKYKFEVKAPSGHLYLKADPFGFYSELRPGTASIVCDLSGYQWHDGDWLQRRPKRSPLNEPMLIYEVHLGSWMRSPSEGHRTLTYRELAEKLVDYVVEMGYTHIELLPVSEHPLDESWGYQITGYYAPTSRYGTPQDFMYFVDRCHQRGIGVIMDWVPAHFPRDAHGLAWFDGTALYEHADPRLGEHRDWGTLIFNYGRNEVRNFLQANALYWFDQYHLDGLRVDAVASMLYLDYSRKAGEWLPNKYGGNENLEAIDFIKRTNELVYGQFPGILMIAEESTAFTGVSKPVYLGGLGFGFKWNMGWMNDLLLYFSKDCVHRKYHQSLITFALLYAFSENFILVLSHDEVVHGKRSLLNRMPGDDWQRFANLRSLLAFMAGHPGKKLIFMGGEFGQSNEWYSQVSLDWHLLQYETHQGIRRLAKDLNKLIRSEPALYELDADWHGFEWIDFHDADSSIVSFLRRSKDPAAAPVIFVANFTPVVRDTYRVGVPGPGRYHEILNTDATCYGGSNVGNAGGVTADPVPFQGRPFSLDLVLPPLAVLVFKPDLT